MSKYLAKAKAYAKDPANRKTLAVAAIGVVIVLLVATS